MRVVRVKSGSKEEALKIAKAIVYEEYECLPWDETGEGNIRPFSENGPLLVLDGTPPKGFIIAEDVRRVAYCFGAWMNKLALVWWSRATPYPAGREVESFHDWQRRRTVARARRWDVGCRK